MADATLANPAQTQSVMRRLTTVWAEFEGHLERVPILQRLNRGRLRHADYQALLINLRQQVVEGACWIARAASQIDAAHFELRSRLMRHAVTEHADFRMLEANFIATGGDGEIIRRGLKNIGSEALSAFMYHRAAQPNPFGLIGAMFIIEGLGALKARDWGRAIQKQLDLPEAAVSFLLYHGEADADHIKEFEEAVSLVAAEEGVADDIIRCAQVTGRLYALQLEEIDGV